MRDVENDSFEAETGAKDRATWKKKIDGPILQQEKKRTDDDDLFF